MEKKEHVMCVPTELLQSRGMLGEDFWPLGEQARLPFTVDDWWFLPRDLAETDERFRQIIPYVVVCAEDTGRILAYQRKEHGSESRLHGRWSIGWGGHINIADFALSSVNAIEEEIALYCTLDETADRELYEELMMTPSGAYEYLGCITTSAKPVNRVHMGVVMRVMVTCEEEVAKERMELEGARWVTVKEAGALESLEGWSCIALAAL